MVRRIRSTSAAPRPTDPAERRRLWSEYRSDPVPASNASKAVVSNPRNSIDQFPVTIDLPVRPDPSSGATYDWFETILKCPAGSARAFTDAVARRITDGDLAWIDRQNLLRLATTLDVGRFEANLLIAAVLHRSRGSARRRPTGAAASRSLVADTRPSLTDTRPQVDDAPKPARPVPAIAGQPVRDKPRSGLWLLTMIAVGVELSVLGLLLGWASSL